MSDGVKRAIAIVFVVLALGYAGYTVFTSSTAPGGSERDEVVLVCLACKGESIVTSAVYREIERNPDTGRRKCPKCGEFECVLATMRCHACERYIPPQPMGSPFVCPHCGVSLASDAVFGPPE